MKREIKVFITFLIVWATLVSLVTDSYAGQASATASILIIIPERPATTPQTKIVQENTQTREAAMEKELLYAKKGIPGEQNAQPTAQKTEENVRVN